MVVIRLRFLAGRFHATPWGRNVNEGDVEWPPSPFRLARALVDVRARRFPDLDDARLTAVLELLAAPVRFSLPPAAMAHTRAYLSSNDKDPTQKQLIFDAFVALSRHEPLYVGLEADADATTLDDLENLLTGLTYLGRSESWTLAELARHPPALDWNCRPAEAGADLGQRVRLACLLPRPEYDHLPVRPEAASAGQAAGRKKGRAAALVSPGPLTTPEGQVKGRRKGKAAEKRPEGVACSWLEALCLSTSDLLKDGWSQPPCLRWIDYALPAGALRPQPAPAQVRLPERRSALFALDCSVLPRVEDGYLFADRARAILMGIHRKVIGGDPAAVSGVFSGKDAAGAPLKGHRHAFFLPLDEDGDGRLDHLLIHAAEPFTESELEALDSLRRVWQGSGRRPDVTLVLASLDRQPPLRPARVFASATPFLASRHYRQGRGPFLDWLAGEIRRECAHHGLPEPVVLAWTSASPFGREPKWWSFARSRKPDAEPPKPGFGVVLRFPEPAPGPFSLGEGCHFGMGLFRPFELPPA